MKAFVLIVFCIFGFNTAYADSDSYVQGVLGFESGAVNIGFDFESRDSSKSVGFGGYFLYSAEERAITSQILAFGVMSKIHIFEDSKVDVSVAPGFGVSLIEQDDDDATTFGPVLKIGLLYKFSDKVAFGGEVFKGYNWLSDEFQGSVEYFNFAVRLQI